MDGFTLYHIATASPYTVSSKYTGILFGVTANQAVGSPITIADETGTLAVIAKDSPAQSYIYYGCYHGGLTVTTTDTTDITVIYN